MISEELRRKLEAINRGPLQARPPVDRTSPPPDRLDVDRLPGARELITSHGKLLLIERTLADIFPDCATVQKPFRETFLHGRHNLTPTDLESDWGRLMNLDPADIVFLDIETLGLGGGAVFLVGLMRYDGSQLMVSQLLARDYSEEPHMLAHLVQCLRGTGMLVTFNGKSFDWPMLCERSAAHRVGHLPECFHFDLLHESRRRFKHVLPNCRLQTLEYHVCHRRRYGDIPGAMIPEVYHQFVRTGDATRMKNVLHHNALDVITMAEILSFLASGGELVWGD